MKVKSAVTVFFIGVALGAVAVWLIIGSGIDGGLLAGAAAVLFSVFGVAIGNGNNNSMAESIGKVREGIEASSSGIDRSEEHIENAANSIRQSVDAIRSNAKPIGDKQDS